MLGLNILGIKSKPYSVTKLAEQYYLDFNTVKHIKNLLGIKNKFLTQEDNDRIENVILKVDKLYGKVTLSTVNKFIREHNIQWLRKETIYAFQKHD